LHAAIQRREIVRYIVMLCDSGLLFASALRQPPARSLMSEDILIVVFSSNFQLGTFHGEITQSRITRVASNVGKNNDASLHSTRHRVYGNHRVANKGD
jgi:hypothetical protein